MDQNLTRTPKRGGIPEVLLEIEHPVARPLACSSTHIYYVRFFPFDPMLSSIHRIPKTGGAPELILEGRWHVDALAISDTHLAFTDYGDDQGAGSVFVARLDGSGLVRVATALKQPRSLALDDRRVYWACYGNKHPSYFEDGSVWTASLDDLSRVALVAENCSMARSIVLDGDEMFWTEAATGGGWGAGSHRPGAIRARDRAGGDIRNVVSWPMQDGLIAVHGEHVYWLDRVYGQMFRVPRAGGEPERLLERTKELLLVHSFHVYDDAIYWACDAGAAAGGTLFRMAR